MSTTNVARDLDADLAICEAATDGPWNALETDSGVLSVEDTEGAWIADTCFVEDSTFIAEARQGWPYAIRRAQEAEREIDRLRNELDALQRELNQHHRSACYD